MQGERIIFRCPNPHRRNKHTTFALFTEEKKKKEEKNIQKKKSWVQRIICGLCWNYEAGLCCLIGKRGGGKNRTCSRIEESLMLLINLVAKFAIVV